MDRLLSIALMVGLTSACDGASDAPAKPAAPPADKLAKASAEKPTENPSSPAAAKPTSPEPTLPEPDERAAKVEPSAPADAKLDALPPPPGDDGTAEPAPAADAPATDDTTEPPDGGSGGELPTPTPEPVPVTTVEPAPATAPWREVLRPQQALTFEPLIGGVLAHSKAGYHDVDSSGQLVLRSEIESPSAPILGYWPKNAWHIETRTRVEKGDRSGEEIREIRLMRLRGKRRWVPQEYEYEQRFEDDGERFAIGGKGGLLVESEGSIERVAGQAAAPEIGSHHPGRLEAFFESRSGRLYTVHHDDGTLYVQRDCIDDACVANNAMTLPDGPRWEFGQAVPRQRHSISTVAQLHGDEEAPHLLHYETGGWKLDRLSAAPTGVWPCKDGGLWAQVGDELLHRDADGGWRRVQTPPGASSISVAMRGDAGELWIAATVGGATVVFSTHAQADKPPPDLPAEQAG